MTNDDGVPLADAIVTLTYQPELAATQFANTRTGADGRYELQLSAQQPGNVSAVVRATSGAEYSPSEQFVRVTDGVEKNLRLRRIRTITVGQSATIRFDSDSSVCSSLGFGGLCEWVRIQPPTTFTYKLEIRANANGAVVPSLVAGVGSSRAVGQGVISVVIGNDEYPEFYSSRSIDIAASIPVGTAPQEYEVTVSVHQDP